jgi:hypothetical protein
VIEGKTPEITILQVRALLASIDLSNVVGPTRPGSARYWPV